MGKKKPKLERHPNAVAWDAFLESEKGKSCCEGTASGEYLQNRLWWAFNAGWDARTALDAARTQDQEKEASQYAAAAAALPRDRRRQHRRDVFQSLA